MTRTLMTIAISLMCIAIVAMVVCVIAVVKYLKSGAIKFVVEVKGMDQSAPVVIERTSVSYPVQDSQESFPLHRQCSFKSEEILPEINMDFSGVQSSVRSEATTKVDDTADSIAALKNLRKGKTNG
jgi:hypothetical protein